MCVRGHSTSLKVVLFESLCTVSYSPSIVTMAVSSAISEIFSDKEWPDLEIWVWRDLEIWLRGLHSRSLKQVPFKSLSAVSYSRSIVTMAISVAICEIFSEWCDLDLCAGIELLSLHKLRNYRTVYRLQRQLYNDRRATFMTLVTPKTEVDSTLLYCL